MTMYYFNGKPVKKGDIPPEAKLKRVVSEEHWYDEAGENKLKQDSFAYFAKAREQRENLDNHHG